jgi:hypothetical protein
MITTESRSHGENLGLETTGRMRVVYVETAGAAVRRVGLG